LVVVGTSKSDPGGVADVYDTVTDTWTKTLLTDRTIDTIGLVVGDVALFGGGALWWETEGDAGTWDVVNIYDSADHQWSSTKLAQPRSMPALAVAGTRAFFAGGEAHGGPTDTVDIFDAASP